MEGHSGPVLLVLRDQDGQVSRAGSVSGRDACRWAPEGLSIPQLCPRLPRSLSRTGLCYQA